MLFAVYAAMVVVDVESARNLLELTEEIRLRNLLSVFPGRSMNV
jgi:hypothetical protein